MHPLSLRKADRATYQSLDPRPQSDVLTLDFLCLVFADSMLLGINVSLISAPPVSVILGNAKRPLRNSSKSVAIFDRTFVS